MSISEERETGADAGRRDPPGRLLAAVRDLSQQRVGLPERLAERASGAESPRELAIVRQHQLALVHETQVSSDAGPQTRLEPEATDELELPGDAGSQVLLGQPLVGRVHGREELFVASCVHPRGLRPPGGRGVRSVIVRMPASLHPSDALRAAPVEKGPKRR